MFVLPKPNTSSTTESNTSSTTDGADVAELLLNLSIFGVSQLSASDQHEKTKEMYNKVVEDVIVEQLPEESEENLRVRAFTELFKKLPFPDQNNFLSTVIKKFKRERQIGELISWFSTQLDAIQQQELIEEMVHVAAGDETITNEDLRLRRFTQLCRDYTDYVYEHLVAIREEYIEKRKDTEETSGNDQVCSDWQSRFAEFFLGFSIIWFKGQSSYGQWQLIEQLCDGVKGVIIEKLEHESEADFKLRRFTALCEKVVDFGVQVQFLDKVEQKLLHQRKHLPHGMLLQPQDSASAAEPKRRRRRKRSSNYSQLSGLKSKICCDKSIPFSPQFIKVKIPNLGGEGGGGGVAITQGGGDGAASQGGQGTNQNNN